MVERLVAPLLAAVVLAAACGGEGAEVTEVALDPTTTASGETPGASGSPTSGVATSTSTSTTAGPDEAMTWPEPTGPPPWRSAPLGLAPATHVVVEHGPQGFLAVSASPAGAVIRLSDDGVEWRETAVVQGPDGQEQFDVRDLVVTGEEYLMLARTWTNRSGGSTGFTDGLWYSADGVSWDSVDLAELDPALIGAALLVGPDEIVVAGTRDVAGSGQARPGLWTAPDAGGPYTAVHDTIDGFDPAGWVGGTATGDRIAVWIHGPDGPTALWQRDDGGQWSRSTIPTDDEAIESVLAVDGRWLAKGGRQVWLSDDGVEWRIGAGPEAFATDRVSQGGAIIRALYQQDGLIVAAADSIDHRSGAAWCFADPTDCGSRISTVVVTADGVTWRRLPLPGEEAEPGPPAAVQGLTVDGRLAVVHTVDGVPTLSILDRVENSVPLDDGQGPDLSHEVVGPGDELAPGQTAGYRIYTHCDLPAIGPLNETYWVVADEVETGQHLPGWGGYLYGFVTLVDADLIEYRLDDVLVARYRPDPDHEPAGCL